MEPGLRVCITGASGFVGRRLVRLLLQRFVNIEILVLGRKQPPHIKSDKIKFAQIDLVMDKWETIFKLVLDFKPTWIILMAAATLYNPPDSERDIYMRLNAEIPGEFAELAQQIGAKLLWASTDMVFDGDSPIYNPHSTRAPLTIYGASKAAGEDLVRGKGLVVRFPQLYGLGGTFFQSIFDNLQKPNPSIKLFNDEWRTVALGSDVARMCIDFLEHATPDDYKQFWNFGGPERVSRLELGAEVAKQMGIENPAAALQGVPTTTVVKDIKRPADLSMDSSATYAKLKEWKCPIPHHLAEGVSIALNEGAL